MLDELPLGRTSDDDPAYLEVVARVLRQLVREDPPREIWLTRIDNWFGDRWCGFVGKRMGAFGVQRIAPVTSRPGPPPAVVPRLVVPPFVPARVEEVQYAVLQFAVLVLGGYRWTQPPAELHVEQRSEASARRFLDHFSEDGLFIWYSGRSAKNRRGALMAYRVHAHAHAAWHADLRERRGLWTVSSVVGLSPERLSALLGLRPPAEAVRLPAVASAELREILDAFQQKSKSLRHAGVRWTWQHAVAGGERLEIDLSHRSGSVRLLFWGDGTLWLHAWRRAEGAHAGWAFTWAFHGRWSGLAAGEIVRSYQAALYHLAPTRREEEAFLAAWAPIEPTIDGRYHRSSGREEGF